MHEKMSAGVRSKDSGQRPNFPPAKVEQRKIALSDTRSVATRYYEELKSKDLGNSPPGEATQYTLRNKDR